MSQVYILACYVSCLQVARASACARCLFMCHFRCIQTFITYHIQQVGYFLRYTKYITVLSGGSGTNAVRHARGQCSFLRQ